MAEESYTETETKPDNVFVIRLSKGLWTDESVMNVGEQLQAFAEADKTGSRTMVIDLEKAPNMSSSAFGMLINIKKSLKKRGDRLVLANVQPDLLEVMKVTKLDLYFNYRHNQGTVEQVLSAIKEQGPQQS